MKVLLTAIDSKYIHSNAAIRSLKAYAEEKWADTYLSERISIELAEYTINQTRQKIMADIFRRDPDILCFSCYIWNIQIVEELVQDLAKVMPAVNIWLGGPEVSFDAEAVMRRFPAVKGIIRGEGEETFTRVLEYYSTRKGWLCGTPGITIRDSLGKIINTPDREPLHTDSLPAAQHSSEELDHRIVYYESSRGCPFRCIYCLSSIEKTLRFKDMERVKQELAFFLEHDVPQVKFVDRTFNCDHGRAGEIWRFIKEHDNGITNFHFEIAGDLLTDAHVDLLAGMRPGQIQLEIGVQTTNPETLREIDRPMDFGKLSAAVKKIRAQGNVHLHLDLIAGLPFEDMQSFRRSFNETYALKPHQLQLGFLKILKGSPMEYQTSIYGIKHTQSPPYEALETRWVSYEEMLQLKGIEEMVEIYYNTGQFTRSLEMISHCFDSPFDLFADLAAWYLQQGSDMAARSRNSRYEELLRFGLERVGKESTESWPVMINGEKLREAMILDYFSRDNVKTRPGFLGEETVGKTFSKEFYSQEARIHRYLTGAQLAAVEDPRVLRKHTHLEKTGEGYLLFDYTRRDPVTNDAMIISI